ncbi:hypothetical protein N0V94_000903 [Neodidymelliopsis sp. IMI 364377]|nr:hypothetical protein N0V94_000903 [Neodidymelliopsis sp. IMI 364377]
MGDMSAPPPPPPLVIPEDTMLGTTSIQLPASPTDSDKTVSTPVADTHPPLELSLGRGSAMFSTDLGKRAPRKLQGPPYAPVIVRSDKVQGVVVAAHLWSKKYPLQYLCIFPDSGWQIGDLWDEHDIYIETEPFCKEVLKFIERDNYVCAKTYAQNWSKLHPERLGIVGGDLTGVYDKNDSLSIVDKIFVNGEEQDFPRTFLWNVAHIIRTAMLEVKGVKAPFKETSIVSGRLNTEQDHHISNDIAKVPAVLEDTATPQSAPAIVATRTQGPPYPVPMADTTNLHFNPAMSPQNIDSRRPVDCQYSQQYGSGNTLYDPYDGNSTAFKNSATHYNGRKYSQNNFQGSSGLERKTSATGSRPYHNSIANDKPSHVQHSSNRFHGPKRPSEDDPAITQDYEYGCHINWVGPQNTTVTEVFVKDLPEDIRDAELEALFHNKIGVKPKSINAKAAYHPQYHNQGRKHAFVGFSNTAVARQAISIRDPTIRGQPVSITVPKRFFQKISEAPVRDATESGFPAKSWYNANSNNGESLNRQRTSSVNESGDVTAAETVLGDELSYSPQDARSDLHKKKKGKQLRQGPITSGSPEARKAKPKKHQMMSTKDESAKPVDTVENQTSKEISEPPEKALVHIQVEDTPSNATQTEKSRTSKDPLSEPKKVPKPIVEGSFLPVALTDDVVHAVNDGSDPSTNQPVQIAPLQVDPEPQKADQDTSNRTENVQQTSTVQSIDTEEEKVKPSSPDTINTVKIGNKVPEDELENNASSQSVAKPHFNMEPKVEARDECDIANHGIHVSTKIFEDLTTEPSAHTPSDTETINMSAAVEDEMPTPESVMPHADSELVTTSTAMQQETEPAPADAVTAEPVKKGGAQRTESLHPFSKASKAQAKREREQKRKALKKEKEQAEKAKAVKIEAIKPNVKGDSKVESASKERSEPAAQTETFKNSKSIESTKPSEKIKLVLRENALSPPSQRTPKPDQTPKKPAPATKGIKNPYEGRDKPGKRNGKEAESTAEATDKVTRMESNDEQHGKQTGGATHIPKEHGSVTKKEVRFDASVALSEEDRGPSAQSSEPDAVDSVPTEMKESSSVDDAARPSTASKKTKKKKKGSAATEQEPRPLEWPSLEFPPRSPNPAWMGPIDMETDVQNYESIMNEACGESDSDFSWSDLPKELTSFQGSKQSSATEPDKDEDRQDGGGRASDSVAASPNTPETTATGEQIHERIAACESRLAEVNEKLSQVQDPQNPTDITTPDAQPAKKKKNKKRKKKQQQQPQLDAASETTDAAENTEADKSAGVADLASKNIVDNAIEAYDPFCDQLKGIDAIKQGDTSAFGAQNTGVRQHADKARTLADPQFMRTLDGYMRETSQYTPKSEAKKLSKEDLL